MEGRGEGGKEGGREGGEKGKKFTTKKFLVRACAATVVALEQEHLE